MNDFLCICLVCIGITNITVGLSVLYVEKKEMMYIDFKSNFASAGNVMVGVLLLIVDSLIYSQNGIIYI